MRHPDDLKCLRGDANSATRDRRISGEAALPEIVTDHRHPRGRPVVGVIDGAADGGAQAKCLEVTAVDRLGRGYFGVGR